MKIYVASKAHWAVQWRVLRGLLAADGHEVVSSWIDDDDDVDLKNLWVRCIQEASSCDILIAYYLEGEEWKGAFVEIGAALASGRYVYAIGNPPGSWKNHPLVTLASDVDDAIQDAEGRL